MDPIEKLNLSNKASHLIATQESTAAYLREHPELLARLGQIVTAYRNINGLIPQTDSKLFSGHSFPYFESYKELENSIHLAFLGFYKSALNSLRSCLELGLLCVYYDKNDDSERVIGEWLSSREPTPMKKKILTRLSKIDNISALNFKLPILEFVADLYDKLSGFVHTRGFAYSAESLNSSSGHAFNANSFQGWIDAACITVQDLVILFLCKYPIGLFYIPLWDKFGLNPPIGGLLEPVEAETLKQVVGGPALSVLTPICQNDASAIAMAEYITALPDLREDQHEQQAMESDQEEIRRWGFQSWYDHSAIASAINDTELGEYHTLRLRKLENWARENGFFDKGEDSIATE